MSARVLVVGAGGREHALAWGLARSPLVDEIICAPGNPGMATIGECLPVVATDPTAVADLATKLDADLVVVGPEDPLVAGVVDALEESGRRAFGPSAAAARLEGSKAWMKDVLVAAGVPTARYGTFGSGQEAEAFDFLQTLPGLYVVKTDGLAAGKGVVVTESIAEARDAVRAYLSGAAFGDAGRTCVIEEGLTGPEISLFALCDGRRARALATAQDHKRAFDGDAGPNTGGMGAYSPVPFVAAGVVDEMMERALIPTLAELDRRGARYRGVLYCGLMLTPDGAKVLEYNVRFGDPECQVLVPRLASDLFVHLSESAAGELRTPVELSAAACVGVVLAAGGYPPAADRKGDVITGLDAAGRHEGVVVFHSGAATNERGSIVTNGGRVLTVTALGADVARARERAYTAAAEISWPGVHYRRDIGAQALL
ncbi:MAG: phosphoribosylamine---glycine ligase [Actinomycetota bacterium]|nr:phosphoribosylamine---glycine ligase [Actinomycetota bacterium]MDQ1476038.1 phosphoribosylamine---glycine ligase [Actinomycetota bacterium]